MNHLIVAPNCYIVIYFTDLGSAGDMAVISEEDRQCTNKRNTGAFT
jgi:hypothetical protein